MRCNHYNIRRTCRNHDESVCDNHYNSQRATFLQDAWRILIFASIQVEECYLEVSHVVHPLSVDNLAYLLWKNIQIYVYWRTLRNAQLTLEHEHKFIKKKKRWLNDEKIIIIYNEKYKTYMWRKNLILSIYIFFSLQNQSLTKYFSIFLMDIYYYINIHA